MLAQGSFDFSKVGESQALHRCRADHQPAVPPPRASQKAPATPHWVLQSAEHFVARHLPIYWNPKFEADWSAFIRRAINFFGHGVADQKPDRLQLRFATGSGAEALPSAEGEGRTVRHAAGQAWLFLCRLEGACES